MEALFLDSPELEEQRAQAAGFIQSNLQLVRDLIEDGAFEEISEEAIEDIENFEIFDHQLDALGALWTAREAGADRALLHMATGLGKTSVGVFDVIKFYEEFREEHDREPRVLFTCHQNEIIEQAAERFEAFIPDLSQGFYAGSKKERDADITFATLQSIHRSLDTFDPEEFDYIIYDEAHHSKAETFEEVVNHFKPSFQLALTATPDRLDEENIRELFGHEVYSKGLAEALAEDLLAKPDYHIVFDDAVKEAMESGFEAETLKELNQLFANKPRNEVIAQNIKEEMERIGLGFGDVKTIVFCQDIDHAEEMAKLLNGEAYHSGVMGKKARRKILKHFRDGENQVICTRDMFNEGVDIPDARLLVFLRSTSSQTIFEQQLGRGLRKYPGKEVVSVLDFAANVERIAMIRELVESIKEYTQHQQYEASRSADGTIEEIGDDLYVRTGHGDFDFDKMAVDILAKFSELRANTDKIWMTQSNSDIVGLALQLSPDEPLTAEKIAELSKKHLFASVSTIINRFEGITAFQRACGFEVENQYTEFRHMTNDELVERALELSPDKALSYKELRALSAKKEFLGVSSLASRFGSIREFQEACGFTVDFLSMSDDELIEIAKELSPDKPLIGREINELSKNRKFVSMDAITKRFGSIYAFQEACGFSVVNFRDYSDEEIVKLALELSPDKPLNIDELTRLSKEKKFPGMGTIKTRFGGVRGLQRACGFDV